MSKIKFHHLKPTPGSTKSKIRKGRGEAGKRGKTAGRGTKGTGARKDGQSVPVGVGQPTMLVNNLTVGGTATA